MYTGKKRKLHVAYRIQPPRTWYKDQAHEPKFFNVAVVLREESGSVVKGFDVTLKAELLYDNGRNVNRQDILKLSKDSSLKIGESGHAELRFRIDSVSKNHDNHDFKVKISADASCVPENLTVAPAWSRPITVRSKRNRGKRRKEEPLAGSTEFIAIRSWCRFAANVMEELFNNNKKSPCLACGYNDRTHAQSCKFYKCYAGIKHIRPILEAKAADEPKRRRTESPVRFPPTPSRFPSDDFKRHRSPLLSLDNFVMPLRSDTEFLRTTLSRNTTPQMSCESQLVGQHN